MVRNIQAVNVCGEKKRRNVPLQLYLPLLQIIFFGIFNPLIKPTLRYLEPLKNVVIAGIVKIEYRCKLCKIRLIVMVHAIKMIIICFNFNLTNRFAILFDIAELIYVCISAYFVNDLSIIVYY